MTNKDRLLKYIAQMSTKELAKAIDAWALENLNEIGDICAAEITEDDEIMCAGEDCAECIRQWLEKEADK